MRNLFFSESLAPMMIHTHDRAQADARTFVEKASRALSCYRRFASQRIPKRPCADVDVRGGPARGVWLPPYIPQTTPSPRSPLYDHEVRVVSPASRYAE